jgi:general secretion pathway protein B
VAAPAPWPASERRSADKSAPASPRIAAKPQTAAAPPIPRDQLPADVRAELPPLAVGGSMYSTTPANRTLIVDGRLYREGDLVASGLTLEEIRLKSAVFGYKGHRFEVRF